MAEQYYDIDLKEMVFNKVSTEQYNQMVADGTIKENEFYITPNDNTVIPTIDSTTSGKVLSNDGSQLKWSDSAGSAITITYYA